MIHDPMCPNGDPRVVAAVAAAMASVGAEPSGYCQFCPVIAHVREDEAQGQSEALLKAQRVFLREGYAAAVRDAVEAVKALTTKAQHDDDGFISLCFDKGEAAAAIEALGGEQ